jgi:type IV pilus assembly protein PilC
VAQTENPRFIEILSEVLRDVEGGASLSTALSRHKDVFDEIYISLVKTGEAAGNLDKTLNRLAESLEKDREFKGKIKGALLYPVIVAIAMVGVGALMVVVVIPKISAVYEEANAPLPLPTQMLIGLSGFIRGSGVFLLAGLLGLFVFARFFKKTKQGEALFGDLSFKVPVFGELNRQVAITSFVRTLGVLIGSGIAILDALRLTAGTLGYNIFRRGLEEAASQVEKGLPLSSVLQANKNFPPIVGQMVTVGEETGTLDEILARLSAYFETEAEYQIKNLTTALEPFIIILMGVAVAGLAAAVILPLFNLVNVIK